MLQRWVIFLFLSYELSYEGPVTLIYLACKIEMNLVIE